MHILILEDNRVTARIVARCLEQKGYKNVTMRAQSEEAFSEIFENQYDLLIVDWMLPGMDGTEFVRHIRIHPQYQDVPIIMLTGKDWDDDVNKAFAAGVDAYVLKPKGNWKPEHCETLHQKIDQVLA